MLLPHESKITALPMRGNAVNIINSSLFHLHYHHMLQLLFYLIVLEIR